MKRRTGLLSKCLLAITALSMAAALFSENCFAKEGNSKIVRVAYAISPGYQEGGEGEYKSGYGYEYLQKIAAINGWKYEYVYGSFNELLIKLQNGEVDLMGNLTYSKERAEKISYGTYEQGKDGSYLYVNKNTNSIDPQKYETIEGKKIGVCKGQIQEQELRSWFKEEKINCSIVEFDYFDECVNALNNNEIDAVVDGKIQLNDDTVDWDVAFVINSNSFYFGVSKSRPDLLEELNSAQKKLTDENIYFNENVQDKYLRPVSLATTNLNSLEKEWIKDNNNVIRFGYLEGFPPLCYTDENGVCRGVAADVLSSIEQKYSSENIKFEPIVYSDYATMFNALSDGTISAAWPAYDDYWIAEQRDYSITDCVVNTSMMLVYKGKYTDDTVSKIGVINTGSLPKIYANIYYPDSEIYEFDSYKSAISAIISKDISSVLYVSTTYNVDVTNDDVLQKMNRAVLPDTFGISFAVSPEAEELSSILNKGIAVFGEAGVNHSLIINSAVDKEISLGDYIEQKPHVAIALISLFLALFAGIIIVVIYYRMSVRVKTSQTEKKLFEQLSNTDPLTGLYNRQAVFRRCRELLEEHPDDRFVITHIDMVHFRLYNTFFGDKAGDELLCSVADSFREISKDYEYWAYGRIEADVFCLIFPYNEEKYHRHVLSVLEGLKNYRKDFLIEPKIGMYFITDPMMPVEAMFTRATLASRDVQPSTPYATVVFSEESEKKLNEKQQVINEMQLAIDEEQFKVYLQPKYSLRANRMIGAEALVRWIHPTKGMVSPGVFIPIFENNGFITTLDRYMWEHVCMLLSKWKKAGEKLVPVSVNVSRLSMFGSTTVEFLTELIKKYDIEPKYLELELTESAYIDDPEEMKKQMNALKAAGFTILLDDFGSGYSSLNTLREIPVDIIKLDMKFLSTNTNDVRGGLVISSIVRMSKLLKLEVIAEGVELKEQAEFLKSIGCEYVQGFLFARPMPVEEYEKLLSDAIISEKLVNQPMIDHIGRIIADTGSGTYSMGNVIPTPLACIEYENHTFSFIRVNPEFYTDFDVIENTEPVSEVFRKHLTKQSLDDFISTLEHSINSREKVRVPIVWNGKDNTQQMYICSMMYEGNIGTSATIIVTFINITNMVQYAGENQINQSSEIEDKLLSCVKMLVSSSDTNAATNSVIREVMNFYSADRSYIFEFDWEKFICSNTYEACADNVEPVIDTLQNVSIDAIALWVKLFNEKSLIQIKDLNDLIGDESRKDEYDILEPQGIQSLIAAPVYCENNLVGFLGVDNPKSNLENTAFIEKLAFFCVNESIREKEKADLGKMSLVDPLTGVYNRRGWEQHQKRLIRENIPFSLMMLDVDNYKDVNDTYGHRTGDEILVKTAATLRKIFRANDMIIRYGGDEFLVILENTESGMEHVLTKKIDLLNEIMSQPTDKMPGVTMSAGIAFSDDFDAEDLFRNADSALYYVKKSGKKGWHVNKGKD